jgi:hypothetical protein
MLRSALAVNLTLMTLNKTFSSVVASVSLDLTKYLRSIKFSIMPSLRKN